MDDIFVDAIYEAAAVPELWKGQGILQQLAKRCTAGDGILLGMSPDGEFRWIANDAAIPKMEIYVRENWVAKNPYLLDDARIRRFREPRFVMDTDVMSADEMIASEYYQGFMRPHGCFWHVGTNIESPSGDIIKLSIHRPFDDGPLPTKVATMLNGLRPHLARAALLASRLRFEQVKSTVDAMEALGIWAGALKNGRLVVANAGFSSLIPHVLLDNRRRLVIRQRAADNRWASMLEARVSRIGGSFPIVATEEFPAMVAHALPIKGTAHDIFNAADLLLVMTPASKHVVIDDAILAGLYDLTPTEAIIVRDLAQGSSVEQLARSRGVAPGTLRVQLHSIYDKTGAKGQAELARLIAGLGKFRKG
jgi:DNA-binding CsgD family transcriptional regulator